MSFQTVHSLREGAMKATFGLNDPRLRRDGPGQFSAEASVLGFPAGCWPDEIEIGMPDGGRHVLGNEAGATHDAQGELERVEYCSRRMTLTVYND